MKHPTGTILDASGKVMPSPEEKLAAMSIDQLGGWVTSASGGQNQTAYSKLTWVYACIVKKATAITQLKFRLIPADEDDSRDITSGVVHDLLNRPNPYFTMQEVIYQLSTWYDNYGECFLYVITNDSGTRPEALWVLEPNMLQERVNEAAKMLDHWLYMGFAGSNHVLNIDEVISWRTFNPWRIYRGLSPLTAGRYSLNTEESSSAFNESIFNNAGGIGGVYTTEQKLDKPTFDQTMALIKERHTGLKNAGKPLLMQRGTSFMNTSWSPKDIMLETIKRLNREEICGLFGVPPLLVGILDRANYSNFSHASKLFWQDTVMPRALDFADRLTEKLCKRWQPDTQIIVDSTGIEELAENTELKLKLADLLLKQGYTINQVNEALDLGMPEVEWGDTPFINTGVQTVEKAIATPIAAPLPASPSPDAEDDEEGSGSSSFPESDDDSDSTSDAADPEKALQVRAAVLKTDRAREAIWEIEIAPVDKLIQATERAAKSWYYQVRARVLEELAATYDKQAVPDQDKGFREIINTSFAAIGTLYNSIAPYINMALATGVYQSAEEVPITTDRLDALQIDEGLSRQEAVQQMADNMIESLSPALGNYIENTQLRLVQPMRNLETALGNTLGQGITAGESFDQLSDRVRDTFGDGQVVSPGRIARTETGLAQGYSRHQSQVNFGVDEIEWLTAGDSAVRDDHAEMNTIRVKVGEPFNMPDGSTLKYPRDVDGEPGQIINCRCTTLGHYTD